MKSAVMFVLGALVGTGATIVYFQKKFDSEIKRIENEYEEMLDNAYELGDLDTKDEKENESSAEEVDAKFTKASISSDNRDRDTDTNYRTFYSSIEKPKLKDVMNKKNDPDVDEHMAKRESPEEDDDSNFVEVTTEELDEMEVNDNDIVDIAVYEDDVFAYIDNDETVKDSMESLIGDTITSQILNRDKDDEGKWYSAMYVLNKKVNTVFAIQFIPHPYGEYMEE